MTASFPEVLQAARLGADWAWAVIYRDLAPLLLGYLRLRGARDPEDVMGEVFYDLARRIGSFDGDEAAFRSWVFTTATRRLIDEHRRNKRRREDVRALPSLPDVIGGDVEEEISAALLDPRVEAALASLSEEQRAVLYLRVQVGLSSEEVGAALGRRPATVRTLQRRALMVLRQELSPEIETPVASGTVTRHERLPRLRRP